MPTYSKETALYDTGAIAVGIDAAGDTADTYITAVDQNGIKVHAANNVNSNYAAIDATGMDVVRGGTSMAKFGETTRIGEVDANRIELDKDGLVQYTEDGVIGIRAGLSATNHTVDVTHYLGLNKVYLGDVYWYDTQDGERKSSINVEYPFSSDSPNNIDKFILHMYLWRWPGGGSYDVVVPFGSDFSTIINWSDFRIDWDATGKELTITKESKEPNEFDYEVLDVEYTGYVTTASKRSPVLLFGEHSGMRSPGLYAVALGQNSTSDGDNASTLGIGTNAGHDAQTAIGKYNANSSANAFEVGNGTADDARSNAFAVGWDGTVNTATPIPKASGGTGQTGITASSVTLSGCTVSGQRCWHNGVTCSVTMIGVKLSSALANGSSKAFGTLPSGYRPSEVIYDVASSSNATFCGRLVFRVGTDGAISVVNRSGSSMAANTEFSLFVTFAI